MDTNKKQERIIPAGRFKRHFFDILDEVAESREPTTITKHNKAVARILPLETEAEIEKEVLERLLGEVGGVLADDETLLQPTEQLTE